ncbi:hypothetical protein U91I_00464 [alpha proteobacterium U9-1i]|nr:hypothetical protein U91I_00464 [alpha proteobacterium U9-1i]
MYIEVGDISTTGACNLLSFVQRNVVDTVSLTSELTKNLLIQVAVLTPAVAHEYANVPFF